MENETQSSICQEKRVTAEFSIADFARFFVFAIAQKGQFFDLDSLVVA
ncbi:MAG: hypothetical protein ACK2T5_15185 [Anaerolineales bacterium]|jgi:hypothetical protein